MSRIIDMVSLISKVGGLNTGNRFSVQITPPSSLGIGSTRELVFLCDSANTPSINFETENIKHKGYGLYEKRIYGLTFDDITCTFFVDNSGITLGFFQQWAELIYPFNPNTSRDNTNGVSSEAVNYPEEYWGTMELAVKDAANNDVIIYTFDKVAPVRVGDVTLAWEQNDTLAKLSVAFSYRSYYSTKSSANTLNNPEVDTSNPLINTLTTPVADVVSRNTTILA